MKQVDKFLFLSAILIFLAFLVLWRTLNLTGINPNLLLIFFLFVAFLKRGFLFLILTSLPVFLIFVVFAPFWLPQFFLIFVLAGVAGFIPRFLSGNAFFDFLILLALMTVVFYLLTEIFLIGSFIPVLIFKEVVYNLVLGAIFWFLMRSLRNEQF